MDTVISVQTKDFIADALKKEIFSGRIQSGEEVTQEGVANLLGVSRMPVREAFQALSQEGLLKRLPNRHVQVASMEEHQIKETFRMISAMETELLSMLAQEQAAALAEEWNDFLGKEIPDEGFFRGEQAFHESAAQMIDNAYIEQIFRKMLSGYVSYAILDIGHSRERAALCLRKIADSLAVGDRDGLRIHMDTYYLDMADRFLESREG